MNDNLRFPPLFWRLLFAAALVVVALMTEVRAAAAYAPCVHIAKPQAVSWVFARGRYTHDPETGVRVAQYQQLNPVEPLPDQRLVTSGYRPNANCAAWGGRLD